MDDQGSIRFVERQWRRERNEEIAQDATSVLDKVNASTVFQHKSFIHSHARASLLLFNQFDPYLVAADGRDMVTIYNWVDGIKMRSFKNGNPDESKITSLNFVNDDDIPLLAVGSGVRDSAFFNIQRLDLDEGCIRIYRHYEDASEVKLVTSWRALTDLMPLTYKHPMNKLLDGRRTGLISNWHQNCGCFFVSGGVKVIRVWDAERESCVQDISTKSIHTISSLSSERDSSGNLLFAGCTDGSVKKYDRRMPDHDCMVHSFTDHRSEILQVVARPNDELVTTSVDGDIRIWDVRHSIPLATYSLDKELSSVAVGELASVVARYSA